MFIKEMALTCTSRKLNGILRRSVRSLLGQRGGCEDDGNSFCTSASPNKNDSISVENVKMDFERSEHPYKRLFPWKSKNEFVEDLLKRVVFNEGISQHRL